MTENGQKNKVSWRSRFAPIEERPFESLVFAVTRNIEQYPDLIKHAKWNHMNWKGLTLMKDPMTLSAYMLLLQNLKPKSIIEFGTYEGGSALWMSDLMSSLNIECNIHTFDIDQARVHIPENHPNIHCQYLDNFNIQEFVQDQSSLFSNLEGPVLVIEDSHANSSGILAAIDPFLNKGDYLVVEDTLDQSKHQSMTSFLSQSKYLVDTLYCDLWGKNNGWNVNSFLKKC